MAGRRFMSLPLLRRTPRPFSDKHADYQVWLRLVIAEPIDTDTLEAAVDAALGVLLERGHGTVLGAVAGADLSDGTVELEFTLEQRSMAELYATVAEIIEWLADAGFDFVGSTEERVAPRPSGQLQLA